MAGRHRNPGGAIKFALWVVTLSAIGIGLVMYLSNR
jgi:hypothetical protein